MARTRFTQTPDAASPEGARTPEPRMTEPSMPAPMSGDTRTQLGQNRNPSPLLLITILCCLIPIKTEVAGIALTPCRVLFLGTVPWLTFQLFLRKDIKLNIVDICLFLFIIWSFIATVIHHPNSWITLAGSNSLIFLGGYLTARLCIRNIDSFLHFMRIITWSILLMLPFVIYELVADDPLFLRLIAQVSFLDSLPIAPQENRFGLNRVQLVFAHPIHFGLYCGLGVAMCFVGLRAHLSFFQRSLRTSIIGFCCFASLSSGPFLAMFVQLFCFGFEYVTRNTPRRTLKMFIALAILYIPMELYSGRPAIYAIVFRLTFNQTTAYVRKVILENGIAQVLKTPLFGAGYNVRLPDLMTSSVDNHWLMQALIYGIPAFVFFTLAFFFAMRGVHKASFERESDMGNIRHAWLFLMISCCLVLATVAVWDTMGALIYMLLGSGIWIIKATVPAQSPAAVPARHDVLDQSARPPAQIRAKPLASTGPIRRN